MATRAEDHVKRIRASIGPGGHARRACRAKALLLLRDTIPPLRSRRFVSGSIDATCTSETILSSAGTPSSATSVPIRMLVRVGSALSGCRIVPTAESAFTTPPVEADSSAQKQIFCLH
jgi:hypothetical protein